MEQDHGEWDLFFAEPEQDHSACLGMSVDQVTKDTVNDERHSMVLSQSSNLWQCNLDGSTSFSWYILLLEHYFFISGMYKSIIYILTFLNDVYLFVVYNITIRIDNI